MTRKIKIPVVKILTLIALSFFVSSCAKPLPILGELPDFHLMNQAGEPVSRVNLLGSVWVADFVYTGCTAACPLMTQKMAQLVKKTESFKSPVRFVSITVDPDVDTVERLAEYSKRYDADSRRWLFLTGSLRDIEETVLRGFKVSMEKANVVDVFHGEKFVLIDTQGRIRGYYDTDTKGLDAILKGIKQLSKEKP